ncbi:MAG TPA: DUF2007 domain-containing protein [Acidimicrobiia bacterium]|nr:DUF2007 domain-containing protein [Acidimicrobiia bacterium]
MPPGRLTSVISVNGAFRARVLKARLESCGIDARLSGALDGVYGLTVGDMARVDVLVPEEQLDDARYVLLAGEVDAALAAPTEWWDAGMEPRKRPRWPWYVAFALLLVAVLGPLLGLSLRHW